MRYKYIVEKKDKNNALVVREYMENERDVFSRANETILDKKTISSSDKGGMKALTAAFRTQCFYPPSGFADRIAEAITNLLKSKKDLSAEIILDDMDFIDAKQRKRRTTAPVEDKSLEADDFMETDDLFEECSDGTCTINPEKEHSGINKVFPFDEVA